MFSIAAEQSCTQCSRAADLREHARLRHHDEFPGLAVAGRRGGHGGFQQKDQRFPVHGLGRELADASAAKEDINDLRHSSMDISRIHSSSRTSGK
jgi:hypothetical protein